MAVDGFIGLDPDGLGKSVDMSELTVNGKLVERERMVLSDNADPLALAAVKNVAAAAGDYGAVVRVAGSVDVSGSSVIALTGGLTDGQLRAAPVPVSGTFFQATQPVSAVALPLPAGASVEATQLLVKAKTDNLDVALSTRATEATLALVKAKTDNLDVALSTRATEATLATRASEATLALVKAKTDNLDVALSTRASEATVAKDATLGTVGTTELGANTVLDRLVQIGKKLDAQIKAGATEATLKLAVAALQGRPVSKPTSTLLHRS